MRLRKEELEEISSGARANHLPHFQMSAHIRLENYNLRAVTRGVDALGEVSIKINHEDKNIIGGESARI